MRLGGGKNVLIQTDSFPKMCPLSHLPSHHQGSISSLWSLMLMVEKDLARFLPNFRSTEAQASKAKSLITLKAALSPAFLFCHVLTTLQLCCFPLLLGVENRCVPSSSSWGSQNPHRAWGTDTEALTRDFHNLWAKWSFFGWASQQTQHHTCLFCSIL